jgi:hypothetical protein
VLAAKMRAFPNTCNAHVSEVSPLDSQRLLIDADHLSPFFKAIKGDSLLHFVIFFNLLHSSSSKSPSESHVLFTPFLNFFPFDHSETCLEAKT